VSDHHVAAMLPGGRTPRPSDPPECDALTSADIPSRTQKQRIRHAA
jgi:hypothetical protein